jgi:hypothetical protein
MVKVITVSDTGYTNGGQKSFNEEEHPKLNKLIEDGYFILSIVVRDRSITYLLSNNDNDSRPLVSI